MTRDCDKVIRGHAIAHGIKRTEDQDQKSESRRGDRPGDSPSIVPLDQNGVDERNTDPTSPNPAHGDDGGFTLDEERGGPENGKDKDKVEDDDRETFDQDRETFIHRTHVSSGTGYVSSGRAYSPMGGLPTGAGQAGLYSY